MLKFVTIMLLFLTTKTDEWLCTFRLHFWLKRVLNISKLSLFFIKNLSNTCAKFFKIRPFIKKWHEIIFFSPFCLFAGLTHLKTNDAFFVNSKDVFFHFRSQFLCFVIIFFISLLIISHCFPRLNFVILIFLEKPEFASFSNIQSDLFHFFRAQVCFFCSDPK